VEVSRSFSPLGCLDLTNNSIDHLSVLKGSLISNSKINRKTVEEDENSCLFQGVFTFFFIGNLEPEGNHGSGCLNTPKIGSLSLGSA
jgi:hypothetical protein